MNRFTGRMMTTPATVASSPDLAKSGPTHLAAARSGGEAAALKASGLAARVAALEAAVQQLQLTTVQQWSNGKLHLPVGSRLEVEVGKTRLCMDITNFKVVANGQTLLDAGPQSASPAQSTGSVQQAASQSSAGSWQSVAQQNATNNPRSVGSGLPLKMS